ncbi:glycine--tRNA ligase subunit beta [Fundicoccus culcitae]|uniref:Glycine--tRNA ligase beta subunit n=1 Tax=Fundicoccus culcitae TaxID=2969821 RepID=A0ABY5P7Z6_9LACT|nr:glycine--tRNA ligase subunit beta [Fundicoccus culcitae]UUX34610.1 glycine--tRNA ligase subunit beta [Fundicoccus culcitae]
MSHQYLLELGMEEIPARFLLDLSNQLRDKVSQFLDAERISFETIQAYATPRRLAVLVSGLASKQADLEEKAKGPALRIAKDNEGNWTKAAIGFARGQGATVDDLYVETVKDEDYVFVDKHLKGSATQTILTQINDVLASLTFPVTMHWNSYEEEFIRPVHWIVSLLDETIIPFTFLHVDAGNESKGHRFLGHSVVIDSATNYEVLLEEQKVIVDFAKRQKLIEEQIQALATENNWQVPMNQDLLDEVTSIVEWPTAFFGTFSDDYLTMPDLILTTAMRDHQRYFYVLDQTTDELLPYFISVRNGNAEFIENVVKGNEKVLRARLEDGLFFYQADLNQSVDIFNEKLKTVKEHFKLGSLADKEERVAYLVKLIGDALGSQLQATTVAKTVEAAHIYKFDLMTQVVGEFPELQGKMGQIYAEKFGLDTDIAQAIGSQYLPTTSGGALPQTETGALLALADKLDTLVNYFAVDLIPTGSNDPYALRRQATGIVEIIANQNWSLNLLDIIKPFINKLPFSGEEDELLNKLADFIKARIQQYIERQGVEYDMIESVLESYHLDINRHIQFANGLQSLKNNAAENYRLMVEALSRVVNLGVKVESSTEPSLALAQTESEQDLIRLSLQANLNDSVEDLLNYYQSLIQPIDRYFENNLVNSPDDSIKTNRQATLKRLTHTILGLFDPRKLISKF